jgi:hypothetical protein
MRRALTALVLVLSTMLTAHGQIAVYDPAVTARNAVTAALKTSLIELQADQRRRIRRMARRLSLFSDLRKYSLPNPPRWRTHVIDGPNVSPRAAAYQAALNYGDATGTAYLEAAQSVSAAQAFLARLGPAARQDLLARLATLDAVDAAAIRATDDAGRLRFNGRRELAAIEDLESDVLDPSLEQSATAVVDKISGATLIGARQRQARAQLLTAFLEELLMDSKRARDTDSAAMNMQLTTWRYGRAANEAFVAGMAAALRTWRQP